MFKAMNIASRLKQINLNANLAPKRAIYKAY